MRKVVAVVIGGVLAGLIATVVVISTDCRVSGKSDSCPGDWIPEGGMGVVIIATEDIPADTELTPLLSGEGPFVEIQLPRDAVVEGAVTRVEQMKGMLTTKAIGANEQIAESQLCSVKAFCHIGDAVAST